MESSLLFRLKTLIHTLLPLSSDGLFILAGLAVYFTTCLLARQPLTWGWALVPGVLLATAIEGWEILDHYGPAELLKTSAQDLVAILTRHFRDIAVVNLAPGVVFLGALAWDRWMGR